MIQTDRIGRVLGIGGDWDAFHLEQAAGFKEFSFAKSFLGIICSRT